MRRLKLVYVPTPDLRGPDLDRIGTVEEFPDDVARVLLAEGQAIPADDDGDEAGPNVTVQPGAGADTVPVGGPAGLPVGVPILSADDLQGKTKAELVEYAEQRQVDVPAGATKADIVELLAPSTVDAGESQ